MLLFLKVYVSLALFLLPLAGGFYMGGRDDKGYVCLLLSGGLMGILALIALLGSVWAL